MPTMRFRFVARYELCAYSLSYKMNAKGYVNATDEAEAIKKVRSQLALADAIIEVVKLSEVLR